MITTNKPLIINCFGHRPVKIIFNMEDKTKLKILEDFNEKMLKNQVDIDHEFVDIVNKHFSDLL